MRSATSYLPTAVTFYLSYFIHGMAVIMLAQHSAVLQAQWGTTEGKVLLAISGIGIGKVLGAGICGVLSDRFGRRPVASLGIALFIVYFVGILLSPSWQVGFALAALMGIANSLLDAGSYPTLMESYPRTAGTMVLFIKIFVSAGQLVLPLAIALLIGQGMYWGWMPIACAAFLAVMLVALQFGRFPDYRALAAEQAQRIAGTAANATRGGDKTNASVGLEGVALILIGFTSTATFWLAQNSLPAIGQHLAGMGDTAARSLISIYSIGSLISVFVTGALIARWFREVQFLVLYPAISALAYIGLLVFQTPLAYQTLAFVIGFSAAGGVLQLAMTVMAQFFPSGKGKITGIISTASSLSAFALPYATGVLVGGGADAASYRNVVLMGAAVAATGAVLAIVVLVRHGTVFGHAPRPSALAGASK
jgi:MFS family permease